jgi:integrase
MSKRQFGSIRKLPSGKWQACYWHEGTRHVAPTTFPTKGLANAWVSQMHSVIFAGEWMDPRSGEITFAKWCEFYLENATHKRATTLARDKTVINIHLVPVLGDMAMKDITPMKIRALVTSWTKTMAPATVRTDYGVLRAIMNAAVDIDIIAKSPCRGVRMPPHQRKEIRFISPDELEILAAAMPLEYRPMIYVAGVLGLRWSEVAGLRVGRVDLKACTLRVVETLSEVEGKVSFAEVKTPASRRTLSIPKFVSSMLAEHLMRRGRPGPEELVFVSPDGGPLHAGNFRNRVWAQAVKQAGLEGLTFHGLRHSAVGLLIALGAPDHVLQERMGHSSSRVTRDVYGHVLPAIDTELVEQLDDMFRNRSRTDRARKVSGDFYEGEKRAADLGFRAVEVSGLEPPTSTLRT